MADKGPQHALLLNDHWHYSGVISSALIQFIMTEEWEAGGFSAELELRGVLPRQARVFCLTGTEMGECEVESLS